MNSLVLSLQLIPGRAWTFIFFDGFQAHGDKAGSILSLAVRSGGVAAVEPVPEPATIRYIHHHLKDVLTMYTIITKWKDYLKQLLAFYEAKRGNIFNFYLFLFLFLQFHGKYEHRVVGKVLKYLPYQIFPSLSV